jgi:hypothetical protein
MVLLWSAEWAELEDRTDRADCYGKALTEQGWAAFEEAMPAALDGHDDDWLYVRMDDPAYWRTWLPRRRRGGQGWTTAAVNRPEALRRLCFGEFNVAYIRGLAHALRDRGEDFAVVYRAAHAAEPRGRCSSWEGDVVPVQQVIDGHRVYYWPPPGDRSAWGLPTGPNCHHSIHAVGADSS